MKCISCKSKLKKNNHIFYKNISFPEIKFFNKLRIYRCVKCNFGFSYPFVPLNKLKLFYKNIAKNTNDAISKNQHKYYYPDRIISLIVLAKFFINFSQEDRVIDFGPDFGDSFFVINKIIKNLKFDAIELNEKTYKNLNRLGVENIKKDLSWRFVAKKKYKLVIASHVMEHFNASKIKPILLNLKKIITKNGYLLIEVPFDDILNKQNKLFEHTPHLCFFSIKSLTSFLLDCGYKIIYANHFGKERDSWWNESQSNYVNGLYIGGKLNKFLIPFKKLLPQRVRIFLKRIIFFITLNVVKVDAYSILNSEYFCTGERRVAIRILAQKM